VYLRYALASRLLACPPLQLRPEADFMGDFDMFCKAKEDTSARRKNFHVFKWYFFAAEKFIV
jgi:hypothetical protein